MIRVQYQYDIPTRELYGVVVLNIHSMYTKLERDHHHTQITKRTTIRIDDSGYEQTIKAPTKKHNQVEEGIKSVTLKALLKYCENASLIKHFITRARGSSGPNHPRIMAREQGPDT